MSNKRNYNNYSKQNNPKKEEVVAPVEQKEEPGTSTQVVQPEPEAPVEEAKVIHGVVVNCEKLNVRRQPLATAEILTTLSKGEGVLIHDEINGFYKIGNPDISEYVMAKYIKVDE